MTTDDGAPGTWRDGYLTAHDGARLYYRERLVPDQRAHVLAVHGVAEHYGRYRWVDQFLARHGIGFSMMDLRGHGQSDGTRVYVDSFERYLEDLDLFVDHVRGHAGAPFLLGHSLGGLIAVRYVETRRPAMKGLITSGAALVATIKPPAPVFAALQLINRVYQETPVPGLVKPHQLCRDPEVVRRYQRDPLVPKHLTTGFGIASMDAMSRAFADVADIALPCLLLHGGGDQVVDPRGTEDLHRQVPASDKTLKIYPGLYHEIFNEPEREQVLGDVVAWIRERA